LTHDPRKSDIWSLGVTFFEIMMGRTPFEKDGGEHFSTKEELDVYWSRTMKGKWIGAGCDKTSTRMSRALQSLLRRMLEPNADVRIKSAELLNDLYWATPFGTL
jgi:serine/threonine protein kinase